MTRPKRMIPWPVPPSRTSRAPRELHPIGTPRHADGSPNYGYLDGGRWWDSAEKERQEAA